MLTDPKKHLKKAVARNSALAHFNVSNLETVRVVAETADRLKEPVFIAVTENALSYAGFNYLVGLIKTAGQETETDLFLHLDHGRDISVIKEAVKAGFTSIMFDGSALPLTENISQTKRIKRFIKDRPIALEAEIGHVGRLKGDSKSLTDPAEVGKFVQETKVDSLAVSIGTVHGYVKKQCLDFQRLKEIRSQINTPLVIHGCSGLDDEQIKKLINAGANKLNIDSALRLAFMTALKEKIEVNDPRKALTAAMAKMSIVVSDKIKLIRSRKNV